MHCTNCGEQLADDTKFCPKCGKKVEPKKITPSVSVKSVEVIAPKQEAPKKRRLFESDSLSDEDVQVENVSNSTTPKNVFCPNCGKQLSPESNFCPACGTNIYNPSATPTSGGYGVASVGTRFANYILDIIGIYISAFLIGVILAILGINNTLNSYLIGYSMLFFYYLFFEGIWQRTPGKWITKTKVVMQNGSKPDFLHILGRSLSRIIPFEPLSFLAGPVGWHDSLSTTLVVTASYGADEIKNIDLKKT